MGNHILTIIGLFVAFAFSQPASSQQGITFPERYRFHAGDSLLWADPNYDDSDWLEVPANQFPEAWQGVGWFRFVLRVDSSQWQKPQAVQIVQKGALAVYLDGELVESIGSPGDTVSEERAFVHTMPVIVPLTFSAQASNRTFSTHSLAIRYSSHFLDDPVWSGFDPGFSFDIRPLDPALDGVQARTRRSSFYQLSISMVSLAFAVLHITLFAFYPRPRTNLFFGLVSLGFAINVFFDVQNQFTINPTFYLWNDRLNAGGTLLLMLAALPLVRSLFYEKVPRHHFVLGGAGVVLLAAAWFRPSAVGDIGKIYILIVLAELARLILTAVFRRRKPLLHGSWVIAVGLFPAIALFLLTFLNELGLVPAGFMPAGAPLERYGLLFFLGSISIFLARNFAWINHDLEAKRNQLQGEMAAKEEALDNLKAALQENETLRNRLQAENVYLQQEIDLEHNFGEILTQSPQMRKLLKKAEQGAESDATILILGETGTGKELLARAIHKASTRHERPLVKVNCATLPANLIESELFGHEKGAFTGAVTRKIGRFELAHGGTIFLDEIGELPVELQPKLLRVLQEGEIERLGGNETIRVDVRIIVATNRDLDHEVAAGRFRQDLFYRLNVFPLTTLPLRERKEDIPLLTQHFVKQLSTRANKPIDSVPQPIIDNLSAYDWPGNVRELENVIERAVILTPGRTLKLERWLERNAAASAADELQPLDDMERAHILRVLEKTNWRVSGANGAASILGLKRTTLEARMKKLNINRP